MKQILRIVCAVIALILLSGCAPEENMEALPGETGVTTESATTETLPAPTEPKPENFVLTFVGDCTFADNIKNGNYYASFYNTIKDDYDFPFQNVREYFLHDDLTLVNLECALTDSDPTEKEMESLKTKRFRFRGYPEYVNILTRGGVEFANLANNHTKDFGAQGLLDTQNILTENNIAMAATGGSCLVRTQRGLVVGIVAYYFTFGEEDIRSKIQSLREQGAQLVIVSIHWGNEGKYKPNSNQTRYGHLAIDAGADIVYGHHSHTLQPVEYYNGGVIYYSLGNFSFGGNYNPADKDTAILQQNVLLWPDGTVTLSSLDITPCRLSSDYTRNNYQPLPYQEDDKGYKRALEKLSGTYAGPDVFVPYA